MDLLADTDRHPDGNKDQRRMRTAINQLKANTFGSFADLSPP